MKDFHKGLQGHEEDVEEVNRTFHQMIRDLESVIQKIDKKIESIKMHLKKVGKRYTLLKRKTILDMAKNLSAPSKK